MDEAVQEQPKEPRAAVQPRTGDGNRWSADQGGELLLLLLMMMMMISQNHGVGLEIFIFISGAEC